MGRRPGRAAVVAVVAALGLVVVADFVASLAGANVDWVTSIVTAVVVGGFLALLFLRPRRPEGEGFTVTGRTQR